MKLDRVMGVPLETRKPKQKTINQNKKNNNNSIKVPQFFHMVIVKLYIFFNNQENYNT